MASPLPPLWRHRDYMLLWGGQLASTLGTAGSQVVIPLLVLALTKSPEAAGIAGALRSAPYLVFSLPVGALIDRWDRKKVMVRCDAGRAVAVATIPLAMAFDALTLWHIYLVTLVEGSLFVFFNIAEVAALPRVVDRAQLPKATAQNEAGFFCANIAGPPIGTVLFQALGRGAPFIANTLTYLVSLVSLLRIGKPFHTERAREPLHLRAEVMEGLRWMWAHPLIRYMALLTGALNFINAATPLAVIVLAKGLGAEDAAIGAVFSAMGVGGVLGSIAGGRIASKLSFGQAIIGVIWVEAILFPLYALMPSFPLLALAAGAYYFLSPTYNVVQFSYRVAIIPDHLQGRVNSVFRLLAFGFMPAGAAVGGILIERLGAAPAVLVLSLWLLAFAILTTFNRHVREAAPL